MSPIPTLLRPLNTQLYATKITDKRVPIVAHFERALYYLTHHGLVLFCPSATKYIREIEGLETHIRIIRGLLLIMLPRLPHKLSYYQQDVRITTENDFNEFDKLMVILKWYNHCVNAQIMLKPVILINSRGDTRMDILQAIKPRRFLILKRRIEQR